MELMNLTSLKLPASWRLVWLLTVLKWLKTIFIVIGRHIGVTFQTYQTCLSVMFYHIRASRHIRGVLDKSMAADIHVLASTGLVSIVDLLIPTVFSPSKFLTG